MDVGVVLDANGIKLNEPQQKQTVQTFNSNIRMEKERSVAHATAGLKDILHCAQTLALDLCVVLSTRNN